MVANSGDLPVKLDKVDPATNGGREYRPDKEVARKMLEKAKHYAETGVPMAMFPEGSMSKTGELKVFRDGFFRLAIETGCSITPVGMWGNQTMWIARAPFPQPGYAEVAIGDPIEVAK